MKDSEREEVERLLATLRDGQARDEDLVPAVLDRIRASTTTIPPRKRPARRRRTAVVVAIASLGLAACAVIPPVREAVVALFRTNGILVRQGPVGPTPSATSATSGASTGSSRSVAAVYEGLGEPITVAEAQAGSSGRLLLPSALGRPDVVFRRGALVTLGYGGVHPRWLVMEVVEPSTVLLEKIALSGSQVRRLTVNGNSGVWIEGPQELVYVGPDREPRAEEPRLSANTLIWEQHGVSVRIETPEGLKAALAVAESMRSG
jgi:hypothetical protein